MKKIDIPAAPGAEELGRWLGRRDAFATIAGRCSAAQAESLKRVRDGKLYRTLGVTWDEFCKSRLGTSRQYIDRTLRLLDEFGPAYFHVAEMAHVSPEEYRAIAGHVGEDGVRLDGNVVALLPENSEQVSAAVAELLRREKPKAKPAGPASPDAIVKRCEAVREAVLKLESISQRERVEMGIALTKLFGAAALRGICLLRG